MDLLLPLISFLLVAGGGGRQHVSFADAATAAAAAAAAAATNSESTPAAYWQAVLPGVPMPPAVSDLLTSQKEHASLGDKNIRGLASSQIAGSSDNLNLVKRLRKIGPDYGRVSSEADQEGLKKMFLSYGSEVEDLKKGTIVNISELSKYLHKLSPRPQVEENLQEVSVSYGSKGNDDVKEISMSHGKYVKEALKEISMSYREDVKKALKDIPESYGAHGEEDVKEVSVTYGAEEQKDLKEVSMSNSAQGKEDVKEVSMSYGAEDQEDRLKEVSVSYGAQGEKDVKEVSVSYGAGGQEDLKEVSVSYRAEGQKDLKEVSVSYGVEGQKDLKEVSVSYGAEGKEDVKEVSMSYGAEDQEDRLKEVSVSYGAQGEKDVKEVSVSYGAGGQEDLNEVSVSYDAQEEVDVKEVSMSYGAGGQEDRLKEVSVSYGAHDKKDAKEIAVSYGAKGQDNLKKVSVSYGSRSVNLKKDSIGRGSHNEGEGHHDHVHANSNNLQRLADVFFFHDALRPGSRMTPTIPPTTSLPALLPRHVADAIPFSVDRLPDILAMFAPASSSVATARKIRWTLDTCEHRRRTSLVLGERVGCATSLESLADLAASLLGTRDIRAFSAGGLPVEAPGTPARRGRHTVKAVRRLAAGAGSEEDAVTCHDLTYPYAVFYCHTSSPTAAYAVTLQASDEAAPATTEVLAVCHLDTSRWRPDHPFFVAHGVRPGDVAVCHFLSKLSIVWVRAGGAGDYQRDASQ